MGETKTLTDSLDFYEINGNGDVSTQEGFKADFFIDEEDIGFFTDKETMLQARNKYGKFFAVIRNSLLQVNSNIKFLPQMVLGSKTE